MNLFEKLKKDESCEDEKLTDRVFMRSIITSFFAIIMCIIMLGASTYAWFTTSVQSNETITSAVYVLSITVNGDDNGDGITEYLYPTGTSDGNDIYTFKANTTYTIVATSVVPDTTANSGYIKLKIGEKTFISQQIDRGQEISFTLRYDEETEVTLIEGWGMSSAEVRDILDKGTYSNLK